MSNVGLHEIKRLNQDVQSRFNELITAINNAGYDVIVTSGKRTYQEQAALNRQNPKNNAYPGTSRHEKGTALDINIRNRKTGKQYFKRTSRAEWEDTGIPKLAEGMGFVWGGVAFGSYHDPVHFQFGGGGTGATTSNSPIGSNNSNYLGNNVNSPLAEEHTTNIKYFWFDNDFIERGKNLYKEYNNKQEMALIQSGSNTGGDVGFVPLTLDITFEGISGWVIYDKLKINQNILPPQYPRHFNFIITGVSHTISGHDWKTNIQTLSVPDVDERVWVSNGSQQAVAVQTGGSFNGGPQSVEMVNGDYSSSKLSQSQIRQIFANAENSGNTSMSAKHNGGSSAVGPYGILNKGHLWDMWLGDNELRKRYPDYNSFKATFTGSGPQTDWAESKYQNFLKSKASDDIRYQLAFNLGGYVGLAQARKGNWDYKPAGNNMTIGKYVKVALKQ